jgi:hypothetical protein
MGIFAGGKAARASGGTVTTAGPYTVHAFTTTGANTFTPATTGFIDILLVGGGGQSGSGAAALYNGGGGAGATLFKKMIPVTASTPYPVNIGGSNNPTTFIYSGITISASAGGLGGSYSGPPVPGGSQPLASGGGGSVGGSGGTGAGITGIGYPGGSGPEAGGGGGAGGAGLNGPNASPPQPGAGGPGVPITYFTGISTDIVSVGGPRGVNTGITSTSYGSGGSSPQSGPTLGPGRPGVAYIRYI